MKDTTFKLSIALNIVLIIVLGVVVFDYGPEKDGVIQQPVSETVGVYEVLPDVGSMGEQLLTKSGYSIIVENFELDLRDREGYLRNNLIPNKIYGKFDVTVINTSTSDVVIDSAFTDNWSYKIENADGIKQNALAVGAPFMDGSVLYDNPFGSRLLEQIKKRFPVGEITPGGKASSQVVFTVDENASSSIKLYFEDLVIKLQ